MNAKTATGGRRLIEIDLLRFVAAMSVLLFHHLHWSLYFRDTKAYALSRYGDLGVPLFFMISGFVILWSAQGKTVREFARSRALRLYPTFWLCLALATVADFSLGGKETLIRVAANFTMAPELFGQKPIDVVYWTLLVELKFYAAVAILIFAGQMPRIESWLLLWLVAVLAAFASRMPAAFTATLLPWAPYFIGGAVLYLAWAGGWKPLHVFMLLACAALSFRVTLMEDGGSWSRAWVVMGIYTAMTTLALRLWRLPDWRIWGLMGSLTYPLYLLHSRPTKAVWGVLPFGAVLRFLVGAGLALLAAYLVAQLVESRPFRGLLGKPRTSKPTLEAGRLSH